MAVDNRGDWVSPGLCMEPDPPRLYRPIMRTLLALQGFRDYSCVAVDGAVAIQTEKSTLLDMQVYVPCF